MLHVIINGFAVHFQFSVTPRREGGNVAAIIRWHCENQQTKMKLVFFAAVVALVSCAEATKHSKYIFSDILDVVNHVI